MDSKGDIIPIQPPLPWLTKSGCCGFVSGIGASRLLLSSIATPPEDAVASIQVALYDETLLTLTGKFVHLQGNRYSFYLDMDKRQAILEDLKGRLRKEQHIAICQTTDVEASDRFTGFAELSFTPVALPELNYDEISTTSQFLDRSFALPILITGMTGGTPQGSEINRRLAHAASSMGIPMGVGSQRVALESPELKETFDLKREFPELFLIGNIGCSQLTQTNALDRCRAAVEMIGADALAIHVNVLQECIQIEGDRSFRSLFDTIGTIQAKLSVPIIVKEVGVGIDPATALRLHQIGIKALDIGGKGGTSWAFIEGQRTSSQATRMLADSFRDFGIPTAFSLKLVSDALPHMQTIATGGIRDGLTVAKAVALGARMVGIGLPLFRAALESETAAANLLDTYAHGLKTAMLATACRTLRDLKGRISLGTHPLLHSFQASFDRKDTIP